MIVYKITNKINGKMYIGQSNHSINKRIAQYSDDVKYRNGYVRPIVKAMRKYGFENFLFDVLEENISNQEVLDETEIKYIKLYDSVENGYNFKHGGNGGLHKDSTKQKISKAQIGCLNHMWGKCGNMNGASKRTLDLTTGVIYESAIIASKEFNLSFSHVCSCARGLRGSTGGRTFRYVDDMDNPISYGRTTKIGNKKIEEKVLPKYKYLL